VTFTWDYCRVILGHLAYNLASPKKFLICVIHLKRRVKIDGGTILLREDIWYNKKIASSYFIHIIDHLLVKRSSVFSFFILSPSIKKSNIATIRES
jgi:hypothetical protein